VKFRTSQLADGGKKVRLAALVLLIIATLSLDQAQAEDLAIQPLTRADCNKADMWWDDNANVCGSTSAAVQTVKPSAVEILSQPLTRSECEAAGMMER